MYPFERFSDAAKKSLTLAQQETEHSHHSYIGSEHILLALLQHPARSRTRCCSGLALNLA